MGIIEEIERKALTEIDTLRLDKISLMKKLNEEIKSHNIERKRREMFESKTRNLIN
jgi:hypothetical protein